MAELTVAPFRCSTGWLGVRLAQMEAAMPSIGRDQSARDDPDAIAASL